MISILTVTYNSRKEIERFLLSLSEMLKNFSLGAETRIWDNASSDGTAQYLLDSQRDFHRLAILLKLSSKNVGLSKAVNSEIADSRGEWILLCNPDVEFSNEVPKLLEFAFSHPEYGVVPDLKNPDGTTQRSIHRRFPSFTRILFEYTSLGGYSSRFISFVRDDYKYSHTKFASPNRIEQPGGSFLLLHRKTLNNLLENGKLFDERFPVFWNDVDMSMRAKARGVKFVIAPEFRILHGFGHSIKKANREMLLTLFFGSYGLIGFARKWKMHPRVIQTVLFLDAIFALFLGLVAKFAHHRSGELGAQGSGHVVVTMRWRIMKFWCSIH
ncbi:glycosyltransferase [Candidatus Bathyarchaeota archaeon]|nr:MAG: glycosyltransferase [Candidatus Bathyarchaeota archaeon]